MVSWYYHLGRAYPQHLHSFKATCVGPLLVPTVWTMSNAALLASYIYCASARDV